MSRIKDLIRKKAMKNMAVKKLRLPKKKTGAKHGDMLPGYNKKTNVNKLYIMPLLYATIKIIFSGGIYA